MKRWKRAVPIVAAGVLLALVGREGAAQPRGRLQPVRPRIAKQKFAPVVPSRINRLRDRALTGLEALCESQGQRYGAGANRLVALDDKGAATATVRTDIRNVAGLSAYRAGVLLIGDGAKSEVLTLDVKTGKTVPIVRLSRLRARDLIAAGVLRGSNRLSAVASDGEFVFVALQAGYSSSVLKVDTRRSEVIEHAWAPGPEPVAMACSGKDLFVIDDKGGLLRRFDDRLRLSDEAIRIQAAGPAGLIIRPDGLEVLSTRENAIIQMKANIQQLRAPIGVRRTVVGRARIDLVLPTLSQKVAVLICGDVAESGYDSFWNDTVWMYKALREAGYARENIYVLYGDGVDFDSANPFYQTSETVTDFPATTGWVNTVFDGLKNGDATNNIRKMRNTDTLFVWTFDHGGGLPPNVFLCLRNGNMSAEDFAEKVNAVPYSRRVIFMQQCRSGGFIPFLKNDTTFISTACRGTENAYVGDNNETVAGVLYTHGEYNFHVISAIHRRTPPGAMVNADGNGNGRLSAREIHDYETSQENSIETPQMDDAAGVGGTFILR